MGGLVAGYYRFAVWTTRFAYLNLLWIGFTVIGLGVFGFFPATAAMFAVVRKWIRGEKEIAIFNQFWKEFKDEFIRINILGYILAIIGYVLYLEFAILRNTEKTVYIIASYGVIALFIVYFIILLYIFPLFAHFKIKTFQYIRWSFIIGIVHPILTIALGVGLILLMYIVFKTIIALLFFFGGSVIAYIVMWGASQTFSKYEN